MWNLSVLEGFPILSAPLAERVGSCDLTGLYSSLRPWSSAKMTQILLAFTLSLFHPLHSIQIKTPRDHPRGANNLILFTFYVERFFFCVPVARNPSPFCILRTDHLQLKTQTLLSATLCTYRASDVSTRILSP